MIAVWAADAPRRTPSPIASILMQLPGPVKAKIDFGSLFEVDKVGLRTAQKQASAQATQVRTGELDQSLTEILQAESNLMALKKRLEAFKPIAT